MKTALGMLLIVTWFASEAFCRELNTDISCLDKTMHIYVESPSQQVNVMVIFIPNIGYMDHSGKIQNQEIHYPPDGVFAYWARVLNQEGFITVRYDKLGVGKSGGSLKDESEISLLCVLEALDTLRIKKENKYLLFTFREGFAAIRNVLSSLVLHEKELPLGIVHQGNLGLDIYGEKENKIPVLTLLPEVVLSSGSLEDVNEPDAKDWLTRYNNRLEYFRDSKSRIIVPKNADEYLCDKTVLKDKRYCHYPLDLRNGVLSWLKSFESVRSTIKPAPKD